MKINEKDLRKVVREIVRKKVTQLKEASDFTARRQVVHSAREASMEFESQIIGLLNIKHPDKLPPSLQKRYFFIVNQMQEKIVEAVQEATRELAKFPKNEEAKKK